MRGQKGTHPPTLLRLAERELGEQALVAPGQTVLVAVSGGPDSMALLHVLSKLRGRFGYELAACGVDHGLRAEARAELQLAKELADQNGVPFELVGVQVQPGGNLMARARKARFEALRQVASRVSAACIAIGHHAEDRAETLLLRLLRGTSPAGLAVMPARSGDLIRPLIRARRRDILLHLSRHAIAYAQDPSNHDRRFLRAAVRHDVLPLLETLSPQLVPHLCALADDLCALELEPMNLKRASFQALVRAEREGRASMRVALPGGRVARFDRDSGQILVEHQPLTARPRHAKRDKEAR